MFTGIITAIGTIIEAQQQGDLRIVIESPYAPEGIAVGESIAVNGACLTVIEKGVCAQGGWFAATLSQETLARSAPRWEAGARVNLERSLALGERLSGNLVSGHVDGLAALVSVSPQQESFVLVLDAPPELAHFIAEKGSVTLDGVALTVNRVDGARFEVCVIPHTWQVTTLHTRVPGDVLNFEVDLIARYLHRFYMAGSGQPLRP